MKFNFKVDVQQRDGEWATVGLATSLEFAKILAFGLVYDKCPPVRVRFGERTVVTYVAEDLQTEARQ
jgi:hypothetical protein